MLLRGGRVSINIYTCFQLAYNTGVVRAKSKVPQKRTAFVVVLTACVVIFAFFLLSKNSEEILQSSVDPVAEQKVKILAIVSSREPLTEEQKNTLFLSLSGPRMLQYQFTGFEKNMIVKALNAANAPKETAKKNSSANGGFSGTPFSKLSF